MSCDLSFILTAGALSGIQSNRFHKYMKWNLVPAWLPNLISDVVIIWLWIKENISSILKVKAVSFFCPYMGLKWDNGGGPENFWTSLTCMNRLATLLEYHLFGVCPQPSPFGIQLWNQVLRTQTVRVNKEFPSNSSLHFSDWTAFQESWLAFMHTSIFNSYHPVAWS